MTANTAPIYGLTPQTSFFGAATTAANTATDGTGTVVTIYTAGANGGYLRRLRVKGLGTNVQSVIRIFINNGSTTATAANNCLFAEYTLAATTAANNAAIGPDYEIPMNLVMKAANVITVCFGTAGAGGWQVYAEAIDY